VILALLMVPVFFVSVQRVLVEDREPQVEKALRASPEPAKP
jgi:multidrug efflux pump